MKLLATTTFFPLVADRGSPLRIRGLIDAMRATHDVTVLATRPSAAVVPTDAALEAELGVGVETFTLPKPRGRARRWMNAAIRGAPYWITQHRHEALRSRLSSSRLVDAVIFLDDYAPIELDAGSRAALRERRIAIVMDKHNVLGSSMAQGLTGLSPPERARSEILVRLARRFERRVLSFADHVVVTSPEEQTRLRHLYGMRATVVPSAVDLPTPAERRGDGRTVGFLGPLDYLPNLEGLNRFLRCAWPELARDGARLIVAGHAPDEARMLESEQGIELRGFVPDLEGFLGEVDVAVIPLWKGPGVKLKTLRVLGSGIPTVATPVALEGITAVHGQHCLVADTPTGLASSVRLLLSDRTIADRVAAGGRSLVADKYTWRTAGPLFVDVVEHAIADVRQR